MENNTIQEIWNKIKNCKKVLLSLHYGPDGDSLGACVAMKYALEREFNTEVTLVSKDDLDSTLKTLPYSKEIQFGKSIDEIDLNSFDAIIALDSGAKKQFCGRDKEFDFPQNILTINIDHHATNEYFGNLNYVVQRPSACSVLLDIFKETGINFDTELATRILLGIYTDTGYFSHDNGVSLIDAAFLIQQGADYLNGIVNKIKYNTPLKVKKYYALVYNNFKTANILNNVVGYSSTSLKEIQQLELNLSEVRGAINDIQEIGGLDIVFNLTEMEKNIKGSFRSRKNIDVSLFAKAFGGGGHKLAAAFFLEKMPLDLAEKTVLEKIQEVGIHAAH